MQDKIEYLNHKLDIDVELIDEYKFNFYGKTSKEVNILTKAKAQKFLEIKLMRDFMSSV